VILFNLAYGVMNPRKTRVMEAKVIGASKVITGVASTG
jgi:hypothetical protein